MAPRKKTPDVLGSLLGATPDASTGNAVGEAPKAPEDTSIETAPAKQEHAPGGPGHLVSFRLERESYALPLERVERALRMVAPVPLPRGPAWLTGVINMHGQVLPVLDLGQLFGKKAREPHPDQRLLVVTHQPRKIALLVDKVEQVIQVQPSQLEPPSGHLAGSLVLAGVLRNKDDLILVLDPERLAPLDWHEQEELIRAMEDHAALKEDFEQQL